MRNKKWFKILIAILRQVIYPYDVYDREPATGKVLYEKQSAPSTDYMLAGTQMTNPPVIPVPVKWATVVSRVISLIMAILAIFFTGDQLDIELIEQVIRMIFGV